MIHSLRARRSAADSTKIVARPDCGSSLFRIVSWSVLVLFLLVSAPSLIAQSKAKGKPSPTPTPSPTPIPTPPPGCASVVSSTNSWVGSGGLDPSFDTGGIVFHSRLANSGDSVGNVLVQADGKIVTVGDGHNPDTASLDVIVRRFNTDGSLDTSFGTNDPQNPGVKLGYVYIDWSGTNDWVGGGTIDVQGRILATAGVYNTKVARITADGVLDDTFGNNGKVEFDFQASGTSEVAVQTDGRIVVVGGGQESGLMASRLNENGSVDTSFGTAGPRWYRCTRENTRITTGTLWRFRP